MSVGRVRTDWADGTRLGFLFPGADATVSREFLLGDVAGPAA